MKGLTVYQIVHTLAGQLYHLNEHLKVIFESYYELFGGYLKIDKALITKAPDQTMY